MFDLLRFQGSFPTGLPPSDFAGERLSSIGKIRDPNPALAFFKIEFDASSLFVVNLFDHLDHPFV